MSKYQILRKFILFLKCVDLNKFCINLCQFLYWNDVDTNEVDINFVSWKKGVSNFHLFYFLRSAIRLVLLLFRLKVSLQNVTVTPFLHSYWAWAVSNKSKYEKFEYFQINLEIRTGKFALFDIFEVQRKQTHILIVVQRESFSQDWLASVFTVQKSFITLTTGQHGVDEDLANLPPLRVKWNNCAKRQSKQICTKISHYLFRYDLNLSMSD